MRLVFNFCLIFLLAACATDSVTNNNTVGYGEQVEPPYRSEVEKHKIEMLFREARKAARINLHATAIDFCNKAIAINENIPGLYDARALSYTAIQNIDAALADYSKAIMLDETYHQAYINRANLYIGQKNYTAAISDYNKAITLDIIDKWYILYARGTAYAHIQQYESAVADYTNSIKLNKNYAASYYNRGVAFFKLKQPKQAIADLQQFLAMNSDDKSESALKAHAIIFQLGK